jgi:23S rRNA G2445 N2-methylase RlmL
MEDQITMIAIMTEIITRVTMVYFTKSLTIVSISVLHSRADERICFNLARLKKAQAQMSQVKHINEVISARSEFQVDVRHHNKHRLQERIK